MSTSRLSRRAALALAAPAVLAVAGCGKAAASSATTAAPAATMSDGMSGMDMSTAPVPAGSGATAGGITAVPTQTLGTALWQGMKIAAYAMTPVPFLVYDGTTMREVKPPKSVSFHLMVTLNDAQTNVVIPYASVWATITQGSKTPFDESLWPMISRYMGPHYGDDVVLPGTGAYGLSLLISPPVSARHLEYEDVWLKPHTAAFNFHWKQDA